MEHAQLKVTAGKGNRVQYWFKYSNYNLTYSGPPMSNLEMLRERSQVVFSANWSELLEKIRPIAEYFTRELLTESLITSIRQWAGNDPWTNPILCILCGDPKLRKLPWEIISIVLKIPGLAIVRLTEEGTAQAPKKPHSSTPTKLMAAGWSNLPRFNMSGIDKEMTGLIHHLRDDRLEISIQMTPSWSRFSKEFEKGSPALLHLSTPGIVHSPEGANIPMAGEQMLEIKKKSKSKGSDEIPPDLRLVSVEELYNLLLRNENLQMVLLNTCNSGLDFAEYISKNCNVISLGWLGYVEDKLSVDFALFFYQRMLDGASPIEATKAFTQNIGVWNEIPLTAPLVTWLPYIEAGIQPMFQVADKAAMSTDQVAEFATKQIGEEAAILIPPLSVNVDWNVASAINPALSKNGRPAITRMSLQCSRPANNLRLEIICDTGFGSSSFRRMLALVEGVQPISTENIHFPVLHELIERKAERRQINFTVTVAEGNTVLAQDTQSALWMQTNEWMDQSETWPFIPAFVIPNCDVVRTIFDKAIRQLKNIGSPSNDFNGYENEDPVFVDLQMRAIFQTLRDESLKYINPPASPIYVPDNFKPSGQLVRFPDEILLHKRGTCQDLSLLLAACAEHVGIYPLIVLVQGHTFCGYWKDRDAYRVFWEQLPPIERYSGFGRSWIIQDEQKLVDLVTKESLQLMEPTYLTDESWTFERACQKWGGVRFEKKIQNRRFDVAIDIWASRIAIQPISVN